MNFNKSLYFLSLIDRHYQNHGIAAEKRKAESALWADITAVSEALNQAYVALQWATGLCTVVGNWWEFIGGKDCITGEQLTPEERITGVIIPPILKRLGKAGKILNLGLKLYKYSKAGISILAIENKKDIAANLDELYSLLRGSQEQELAVLIRYNSKLNNYVRRARSDFSLTTHHSQMVKILKTVGVEGRSV